MQVVVVCKGAVVRFNSRDQLRLCYMSNAWDSEVRYSCAEIMLQDT